MAISVDLNEDDLLFLVTKFLYQNNYLQVVDLIKVESGKFFSFEAFRSRYRKYQWDEAEKYLFSFIDPRQSEPSLAKILYELHKIRFLSTKNGHKETAMTELETELNDLGLSEDMRQAEKADLLRVAASRSFDETWKAISTSQELVLSLIQDTPSLLSTYKFPHLRGLSLKQLICQRKSNQSKPKTGNEVECTSLQGCQGHVSPLRDSSQGISSQVSGSHLSTSSRKFCPPPPRAPSRPIGRDPKPAGRVSSRMTWLLNTIKHPYQLQLFKLPSKERVYKGDGEQEDGIQMELPEDLTEDDLLYLILKFLQDQNLISAAERLKKESGKFFSMCVLESKIRNEGWREAKHYLSSFIEPTDPPSSMDIILYGLNKLQFLKTKDKPNHEDHFPLEELLIELINLKLPEDKKQTEWETLINLDACRNIKKIKGVMTTLMRSLKWLIWNNPSIQGKYKFRHLQGLSLLQLINQRNYNQNQLQTRILPEGTSLKGSEAKLSASRDYSEADPVTQNLPGAISSHEYEVHFATSSSKQRIVRLTYLNSHGGILGLFSNGHHQVWNCEGLHSESTGMEPLVHRDANLPHGKMINDLPRASSEAVMSCFALSRDDSCLVSSSGGKISMYNPITFEVNGSFKPPPPAAATCSLAFLPESNDMVAIGTDNFTIDIFNHITEKVKWKLQGHRKRVTGLAFSRLLNSLVSAGEDAEIILWRRSADDWEKELTGSLSIPLNKIDEALSRTEVQFHPDQIHLLVVHRTQLAVYEATTLFCNRKWLVEKFSPIHSAIFSCDGQFVYCSLLDGTLRIFSNSGSDLMLMCRIQPSAYIPSFSSSEQCQYHNEIAAHPRDPNEFAVSVIDEVYVFRPLPSLGKWGDPPFQKPSSSQPAILLHL